MSFVFFFINYIYIYFFFRILVSLPYSRENHLRKEARTMKIEHPLFLLYMRYFVIIKRGTWRKFECWKLEMQYHGRGNCKLSLISDLLRVSFHESCY